MKVRNQRWRFYKKKGGPRQVGLRCKEYCPGCIVCESYKFYDEQGRFPSFKEVHPIAQKAAEEEEIRWRQTPEGQAWLARKEARQV